MVEVYEIPEPSLGGAVVQYVAFEDYDKLRQAAKELLKLAVSHMCQDDEDEEAVVSYMREVLKNG